MSAWFLIPPALLVLAVAAIFVLGRDPTRRDERLR